MGITKTNTCLLVQWPQSVRVAMVKEHWFDQTTLIELKLLSESDSQIVVIGAVDNRATIVVDIAKNMSALNTVSCIVIFVFLSVIGSK